MSYKIDRRAYWVWLQHSFQPGSTKPRTIYNRFKDVEMFYNEGIRLWSTLSYLTERDLTVMGSYTVKQAAAALAYAESIGQQVITPECEEYPTVLWNIPDPPAVLYVKGTMPLMDNSLAIGIVGSRKAPESIINLTDAIAYQLSKSGVVVVSGGAVGVDAAAHRGAMKGTSPTIAVLGCGLDFPYLMENELLRQRILSKGGALVSEYPPGTAVQKGTFQTRNRIISGLSMGVVIASAKKKSGTMITAKRATEQNRDIFAIPGDPTLETSFGPNSLIKDGAVPVTSGDDILESYKGGFEPVGLYDPISLLIDKAYDLSLEVKEQESEEAEMNPVPEGLSPEAEAVYGCLSSEPRSLDRISADTGFSVQQVLTALTELELFDLINSVSGQRYSLK